VGYKSFSVSGLDGPDAAVLQSVTQKTANGEQRMRGKLGSAPLLAFVMLSALSVSAQTQESSLVAPDAARSSAYVRDFSSGRLGSLAFLASANAGPLATPEPVASPAPIIATPVIADKKTEADQKRESRNKKIWYSLVGVNHAAAGFDAWSTRSSIQRGARELNPLLKPFASSNAMYAANQVVPAGMDYLGRRLMRSENPIIRKMWWVPQTASAICSLAAGIHNLGVNPR
jgi:hypothetical protein